MTHEPIRFDDGAAYERYMGVWSQAVGTQFLEWLAPSPDWHWLDIGCGNGAFTELIVERCAPATVVGIDPSAGQLAFASRRPASRGAQFRQGDAMALPLPDDAFDAAVMPLVIFFVPDPPTGVTEMVRVVRPGGVVSAYAWDMAGGGFPYEVVHAAVRAMGLVVPTPPHPEASRLDVLQQLWEGAGLEAIQTRVITVERTFENFTAYWQTICGAPSVGARLAAMAPAEVAQLQAHLRQQVPSDDLGVIRCQARAHAITGRVRG